LIFSWLRRRLTGDQDEEEKVTAIFARVAGAVLLTGLVATPTFAQSTPPAAPAPAKPDDRNRKICEKVSVIGSRLATKRVCMTRAEWDQAQLQDRQDLERVQTSRGMKGE
jgi:hypothetical protein